jgi:hypothetical protein
VPFTPLLSLDCVAPVGSARRRLWLRSPRVAARGPCSDDETGSATRTSSRPSGSGVEPGSHAASPSFASPLRHSCRSRWRRTSTRQPSSRSAHSRNPAVYAPAAQTSSIRNSSGLGLSVSSAVHRAGLGGRCRGRTRRARTRCGVHQDVPLPSGQPLRPVVASLGTARPGGPDD